MFIDDLRKSILQKAIQWKLVEQDPNDEPASELLKRIKEKKERLIKEWKIKKEKPSSPITDEEKPFDIPSNWERIRLQDVCHTLTCWYASTPEYVSEDCGKPFISAKNVKPYRFMPYEYKFIKPELFDKLRETCCPCKWDILLTRVWAWIWEAAIIDTDLEFAIYVSLTLVKLVDYKLLDNEYILHWLNSPMGRSASNVNTLGKEASQWNLNVKNVRNYLIPIPPLEEQKRISNKLNELMKLCDEAMDISIKLKELI